MVLTGHRGVCLCHRPGVSVGGPSSGGHGQGGTGGRPWKATPPTQRRRAADDFLLADRPADPRAARGRSVRVCLSKTGTMAVAPASAMVHGGGSGGAGAWFWPAECRFVHVGGWSAPLGIDLRADGLTVLMLGITALVSSAVTFYSPQVFSGGAPRGSHPPPELLLAVVPLFVDGAERAVPDRRHLQPLRHAGTARVCGSGAGGAGGREALAAAMRYLLVSLSASLFYLLGVALVYGQCATVDLPLSREGAARADTWMALA